MALRARTRLIAILTVAVCALAAVGVFAVRAGPPSLPPVNAARLLADTLEAVTHPVTLSGEVRTKVDVGLPELPSGLGGGYGGPASLLIGTQTYKVWRSPAGLRVAHIFDFSEQVLVANHREGWSWDSNGMVATRLRFADLRSLIHSGMAGHGSSPWFDAVMHGGGPLSPPSESDVLTAADRALRALAPYAQISVGGSDTVAGRPVYELVLTPRSPLTLIGRVVVAIDAGTHLPVRFQVFPNGSDHAAIEVGFTSLSFDPIDPAMFDFTPPAGTSVKEAATPSGATAGAPTGSLPVRIVGTPTVMGSGFDTRVAVRLAGRLPASVAQLLPYAGPLASAVTAEVGGRTWLLFGFVGIETLTQDAATLT